jgi:threonine synthase
LPGWPATASFGPIAEKRPIGPREAFVPVKYVSTRGAAPALGFVDVLLAGLASDGGLYVPQSWPTIGAAEIAGFAGRPYAEVAAKVIRPFTGGEIEDSALATMCRDAYAGFTHPAVAPLVQTGANEWVLELFHGPTLAFKDLAMQLLARLMDHALTARGARATIIGATSGDTGGAAIEAFRGKDNIDVFILFPSGRVSAVQRRQMTTTGDPNVHAIAVEGSFDDCQALVKQMFADRGLRTRLSLAGVNSINWARIVAQIVYYFTAAVELGAPERQIDFTVPTGNFGDIFAGYAAKRMGLSVGRLVVATNRNDILVRALSTGRYEVAAAVPTYSPSMDIQVSSNFERLLFDATGRDSAAVVKTMSALAETGSFAIPADALKRINEDFAAGSTDEAATIATIRHMDAESGMVVDPHTAVGLSVARRFVRAEAPMVSLATAHPAKFPDAVEAATGKRPALPASLAGLMEAKENYPRLANDFGAVRDFVLSHARAVRAEEKA